MSMSTCLRRSPGPIYCSSDRSRGSRWANSSPRGSFEVPKQLVGTPNPENSTVYTVRLSTGVRRGAALSEPSAAVMLCLIGEDDGAVLRRVTPLTDPVEDAEEVLRICGSEGGSPPGADCSVAFDAAARRSAAAANHPPTRRFQEGSIDEISFLAPELGPLKAVIVAPEAGSWRCDEINVSSSRSGATSRFVCRDEVGDRALHAAAFLRPVPPGGVVYGSGDASVVLTKEQAAQLREWNMQQYSEFKVTLLGATAVLVALGTCATYFAVGSELALPFALGGTSSLAYQYLLQRRVDGITASVAANLEPRSSEVEPGPALQVNVALSNPAVRAALMAGGLLGSLMLIHVIPTTGQSMLPGSTGGEAPMVAAATAAEVRSAAAGLAGFFMQKVAVIAVSMLPEKEAATAIGVQPPRRVDDRVE